MITSLTSENPKFSFVISKNPETGIKIKNLRSGFLFGWYSNTPHDSLQYNCYFEDIFDENSFAENEKEMEFEYLSLGRYRNSIIAYSIINYFFSSLLNKSKTEYDDNYLHKFVIENIKIQRRKFLDLICKSSIFLSVNITENLTNTYSIAFESKSETLKIFLQKVLVVLAAIIENTNYDFYVDKNIQNRVLKYLENITKYEDHINYGFFYFIKNSIFERDKRAIEKINLLAYQYDKIQLSVGDNFYQRKKFIEQEIDDGTSILDFGCGEGNYFFLSKNCETYYAYDIDKNLYDSLNKKITYKYKNIKLLDMIDDIGEENIQVILSEVIEHIDILNLREMLDELLNKKNIIKVIITTPNRDFNKYYIGDNNISFRHCDHKWEMNTQELINYFSDYATLRNDILVNYKEASQDRVQNIVSTNAIILCKK